MDLKGSCRCGAVKFAIKSNTPCPFCRCYCSLCRKEAGGGGYSINIMGQRASLDVQGQENIKKFAGMCPNLFKGGELELSPFVRSFCKECGTHLWMDDESCDAGYIYPYASAIDTPLPEPPFSVHIMLGSKASWVTPEVKPGDITYETYPEVEGVDSLHSYKNYFHKQNDVYVE